MRLHSEIGELLSAMGSVPGRRDYLEYRAQVGRIQAEFDDVNNRLAASLGLTSAKARLLAYFRMHVGQVITKEQLAGVSGIFEFQRRIRELRQEGHHISSMETHADLHPGEYILIDRDHSA